MENNYIIAVYDFRSKQDYIYKTNKVKEIMGASKLLEDVYCNLLPKSLYEANPELYKDFATVYEKAKKPLGK